MGRDGITAEIIKYAGQMTLKHLTKAVQQNTGNGQKALIAWRDGTSLTIAMFQLRETILHRQLTVAIGKTASKSYLCLLTHFQTSQA